MQGWRSALQRGTREWRPSDDRPDIFYFWGPPRRKEFLLESWPADHSCTRAAALTPREEGAADKLLRPGCSGRLFAAADECRCRIARAAPSPAAAHAGLKSPRRKGRRGRQRRKATGNNTAKTGSVGGAFSGCARRWISGGRKAERVESATPLRCVCLGSFFLARLGGGAPAALAALHCRLGTSRWGMRRYGVPRWDGGDGEIAACSADVVAMGWRGRADRAGRAQVGRVPAADLRRYAKFPRPGARRRSR